MDFLTEYNYLNPNIVDLYKDNLDNILKDKDLYTVIEQSDAYLSLGVCQYFNGLYLSALDNLKTSIAPIYQEKQIQKNIAYAKVLIANIQFRYGSIEESKESLTSAHEIAISINNTELIAISLSNLAIIDQRKDNHKNSAKLAKRALEVISEKHSRTSMEYLRHLRILISVYILANNFVSAEEVVLNNKLPPKEKALYLSGIKFMFGQVGSSFGLIEVATQDKETSKSSEPDEEEENIEQYVEQTVNTYFDLYLEELHQAMLFYNKSVIEYDGDNNLIRAIKIFKNCLSNLVNHRSELFKESDSQMRLYQHESFPNFSSFDSFLYPIVLLTSSLLAHAEYLLINMKLSSGMELQAGNLISDVKETEYEIDKIEEKYKEPLDLILTNIPHLNDDFITNFDDSIIEESSTTTDSGKTLEHRAGDIPDLSMIKESIINFNLLNSMKKGLQTDKFVSASSAELLKRQYNVIIDKKTGQVLNENDKSKPPQRVDGLNYIPNYKDKYSIKYEIMPLIENSFGRDEYSLWIEWSLANSGGIGFGILSLPCPDPDNTKGFSKEMKDNENKKSDSELFMMEVFNRLKTIEASISVPTITDDDILDDKYEISLNSKIILYLLIIKLSAQLNIRKEILISITHLSTLLEDIKKKNPSPEYELYEAIIIRNSIDYHEWDIENISGEEKLNALIYTILPLKKKYYIVAEITKDLNMQRDSIKKLINIYVEINKLNKLLMNIDEPVLSPEMIEQFDSYKEKEIENLEKDAGWIKANARLRALFFMKKLKYIK